MKPNALAVRSENLLAMLAMGGVMLLPLAEIVVRRAFGVGISGAGPYALNLTMWVGLLGAAIAARDGKLLALATGEFLPKGWISSGAHVVAGTVGAMAATLFATGGWAFVNLKYGTHEPIAVGLRVTVWFASLVFPFAFGLIAVRLAWKASATWPGRAVAFLGIALALWISTHRGAVEGLPAWPGIAVVIAAAVLGAPIFVLLGGIALVAFLVDGSAPVVLIIKAHGELTQSVGLAAIPLFTLAGFLLAEGRSSSRLLRVLRGWFGWAPGGTAVAAAALCAFFTLLTGGSGVTILALGGLLLPALVADGYREKFSIGLLTASGSLGLLFPLSVPLILYAIVAKVPMDQLFIGGLLPGLFMLGLMAALGVREGLKSGAARTPFRWNEAVAALIEAKWELMLPIVVMVAMLGGFATPVQSAAVAAFFAFIIQRFIHRDLPTMWDVLRVVSDCVALVGGVLLILSVAVGLTNYMINADFSSQLQEWTKAHINSPIVFLLCLNVFLIVVGCLMDIFSAIIVVVPLILPFADLYHINLVHLGIIFIANLELGYLHPPVGLNLLLASVRFKKPVLQVTWATLPMLGVLALGVLLITYVPWLTTGLLDLFGMNTG
jgi:C4-dicarboxylate transporter DctM subunit